MKSRSTGPIQCYALRLCHAGSSSAAMFVAALIALCLSAWSAAVLADHSWNGYHWARTSNPFVLKLGDNLSRRWDRHLATASSDWSKSSVLTTRIVPGRTRPGRCRPTAGRVEVCNARYGNNGWLGVAQIWTSGDHIVQGITKLNDTYFRTAQYNKRAWKRLVMCQEVGHTLGLDHQDENYSNPPLGTCMDYSNDPRPNQHPNNHDYAELFGIYSHLDRVTTIGQIRSKIASMPPAMLDIDFATPAQWGKRVRSLRHNRVETYELDFGAGNKVHTFVVWADLTKRDQR